MNDTPFPARPVDVVVLTCPEFTFELEMNASPSLDVVCARFAPDMNRALVWLIRFQALQTWCGRADIAEWLRATSASAADVCEVAASFDLTDEWEFDVEAFRAAVRRVADRKWVEPGGAHAR